MTELIIVVDLGHFKVYKISRNIMESTRIEHLRSYDNVDVHGRLGDKLSDSAGSFGLIGGRKGVKGSGEPHKMKLEIKKKLIKNIADDINKLIKKKCNTWHFAANKNFNRTIIENLDPSVRAKLGKNILSDLTKKHKSELLECFEIA